MEYVVQAIKLPENLLHGSCVCLDVHQNFQDFDSLDNILHILTQFIQMSCLMTRFCAQAIFKVPFRDT